MQTIARRPRGRPKVELSVSDEQQAALERWARRPKTAQALALRARIVLRCAQGLSNEAVAVELDVHAATVGKWRRRFVAEGLDGLLDEPRSGAPRRISDEQVEEVIRRTLEERPQTATHWSTRSMAAATGLSQSAVSRIWRAFALQPQRIETFNLSADPLFVEKVRDVVALYLDPPERALVLCVDEKSQIQALDRSRPTLPNLPGTPARRAHDYLRHGTTSLFAALEIASGRVTHQLYRRQRAVEFRKFLDLLDQTVPTTLASCCTSSPRAAPGSTSSNAGSPSSPPRSFRAALTPASKHSKRTSPPGPSTGTPTRAPTSGRRPRTRSSPTLPDIVNESLTQDTSSELSGGTRGCDHAKVRDDERHAEVEDDLDPGERSRVSLQDHIELIDDRQHAPDDQGDSDGSPQVRPLRARRDRLPRRHLVRL